MAATSESYQQGYIWTKNKSRFSFISTPPINTKVWQRLCGGDPFRRRAGKKLAGLEIDESAKTKKFKKYTSPFDSKKYCKPSAQSIVWIS